MADLLVRLYSLPDSAGVFARVRESGIEVRRAIAPEKHVVLDWVRRRFSENWASECDVAFAHVPVSCFIATRGQDLLGFACHDATCRNFFGPEGVDEAARGSGIGAALLFACLEDMRGQGYGYAVIGDAGPADFYRKTVNAIEIPDSNPGVYCGMLRSPHHGE